MKHIADWQEFPEDAAIVKLELNDMVIARPAFTFLSLKIENLLYKLHYYPDSPVNTIETLQEILKDLKHIKDTAPYE